MSHDVGVSDFVQERLLRIRGDLRIFKDLDPARTALVIIDMQNAFLEPGGPIEVAPARDIVEPINRMAEGCRGLGVPVIWIRSHHPGNGDDWRHFFDHFVRPEPGRLVLFPSYMWHGTAPFSGDEDRLTVAFDIMPG